MLAALVFAANLLPGVGQGSAPAHPADWPPGVSPEAITTTEAAKRPGEELLTCGRVSTIQRQQKDQLRAALDRDFLSPPLVLLVSASDSRGYVTESTRGFLVCVRGRVALDAGQPVIRVENPRQFIAIERRPSTNFAPEVLRLSGPGGPPPGVTSPQLLRYGRPEYTDQAKGARIQGTVELECVVESDGRVGACVVVTSLDTVHGLDNEALRTARGWEFKPATRDGVPVAMVVVLMLSFNLY